MSDGQAESGDIIENPEPEADSELSGVSEEAGNEGEIALEDQPEDEFRGESGDRTVPGSQEQPLDVRPAVDIPDVELRVESDCVEGDQVESEFVEGRQVESDNVEGAQASAGCGEELRDQRKEPECAEDGVEIELVNGQVESECAEGDRSEVNRDLFESESVEAEGVGPVGISASSCSDSPEHQQSGENVQTVASTCQNLNSQNKVANGSSRSDNVSLEHKDEEGVPQARGLAEGVAGQCDSYVVKIDEKESSSKPVRTCVEDSGSPEDDSCEQEATMEDGLAPECDRDFNLGIEENTQDTVTSERPREEGLRPVGLEETSDAMEQLAMSEPSSGAGSEVSLSGTDDSPEDVQISVSDSPEGAEALAVSLEPSQQPEEEEDKSESSSASPVNQSIAHISPEGVQDVSDNPEDDVEIGVELCEDDFSSGDSEGRIQSGDNASIPLAQGDSTSTVGTGSTDSCKSSALTNSNTVKASVEHKALSNQHSTKNSSHKQSDDLDDYEDELLSELDAALHSNSKDSPLEAIEERVTESVTTSEDETESSEVVAFPNGLNMAALSDSPELQVITEHLTRMQKQVEESQKKLKRLEREKQHQAEALTTTVKERDVYLAQVQSLKSRAPDDLYLPQIKELEYTIAQQQTEMRGLKDKLSSHDNAAKRAVSTLQNELKVRVDQVTKMYEECVREKDSMVIKYAESEQKNIERSKTLEKLEAKIRESAKDRESMVSKVKAVKAEKNKAVADMESKAAEMSHAVKEMEKLRDMLSSADVRIKWSQNKLKAELEAHKDTKVILEKTNIKLKEAREETQQIRRDCQAMIRTYQESEEIKSNSLDKELKVKETELIIQRQERSDREELYQMTAQELDSLKAKHKDALAELLTLRDKVKCVGEEVESRDGELSKYQGEMEHLRQQNKQLQERTEDHVQLQEDFTRAQEMIKTLDRDISDLMVSNKDLQQDMEGCRRRESELLDLTEKLSRKNAKLQSDNTNLNNQVVTLSSEAEKWKMEIQELDTTSRNLADNLAEEQKKRKEETESLTSQLEEKTKHMENYRQQMEDEKDLNRTLKRKHVSNVKDLTRQLQQARKRLEALENHTEREEGRGSMGSRTSSNGSLNTATETQTVTHNNTNSNHNSSSSVTFRAPSQEPEYPVITEQVEVDKQVLIERIVRLQKAHARKNEKLEFLDDHIHQLVDEIQRKNRIIQNYVMREEAGTLAPEYMDENKALLAKKGGIMASVYSTHQQDGAMTLDLSLEINKKLQSVLEDTLLKNITLKESLDTLGTEIARLSQENRQLQLKIQELPH